MEVPAPEVLLCDTSFISNRERSFRDPSKYSHWPRPVLDRIAAAVLAVTPFTRAEIKVGWARANWGLERIDAAEQRLRAYVLIPLDEETVDEYVRLRVHCLNTGVTLSNNDVWIAATAISQGIPLVTSDRTQAGLPGVDAIFLAGP